jgi:hypothetical protein
MIVRLPMATLFALTVGASATFAADTPPEGAKVAELPNLQVGDWWLPQNRPGRVVVTAIKEGQVTMTRDDGKLVVYTTEINTLEYPAAYGDTVIEKPFNPNLSFPIWPGKEWGGEVKTFVGSTQTGSYIRKARAGGWERIGVMGEDLEAIRIDYDSTMNPIKLTCWYAPKAKAIVKCQVPGAATPGYLVLAFGVGS